MPSLFLVALSLVNPPVISAQAAPSNMAFSTALKSVAVFRDGFGYYVREGRVKLQDGWASTDVVPAAIKGTVRFYSLDKDDRIDTVIIGKENKLEFKNPGEIKAQLADKVGLKLAVTTRTGQRFEGALAKILDDMILLRVGDAFNAVPYDQIQSIVLSGYPVRIKVATKDPNKVASIGMAYLQEGIRWEPSYVLDVHGDQATLALRASMQNTTEKLDKSDVFFVVGSPFVANRGMGDMLTPMPAPITGEPAAKEAAVARRAEPEASEVGVVKAAVAREEAGELYYYKKSDLSLSTNDIAMVSIFESKLTVSPEFEWNADGEEVSYLLNLQNKSGEPLTTGPVLVLEDGKAIGQETVRYTPTGADTSIRLSRGIGIRVEKTEAETGRGATVRVGRTDYIPVMLKGTLTVTNTKSTVAKVKIGKTVRGRVGKLSDDGKTKQTQILSGEPNPINDLEWKITVAPGATKTITYTFETYMSAERAGSPPVPSGVDDPR